MMPGEYMLTVTKPGFAKATQEHIVLQVNVPTTLDLQMQVGATGQTVERDRRSSRLLTLRTRPRKRVHRTLHKQLPLDTRNVVELLSLQPGVTQQAK